MKKILISLFAFLCLSNFAGCITSNSNTLSDQTHPIKEGEIVGKWIDNSQYLSSTLTVVIYKRENTYILKETFEDDSFVEIDLEKQGDIFNYQNDSNAYYKIENDGLLSLYDDIGIIIKMKKIE